MKTIQPVRICVLAAIATLLVFIPTGCGHTTKIQSESTSSVGQQLVDLDKARKDGLINDKEYEKLRKSIVNKND